MTHTNAHSENSHTTQYNGLWFQHGSRWQYYIKQYKPSHISSVSYYVCIVRHLNNNYNILCAYSIIAWDFTYVVAMTPPFSNITVDVTPESLDIALKQPFK